MTYNQKKMREIISDLRTLADELEAVMQKEASPSATVIDFINRTLWCVAMLGLENLVAGLDK